MTRLKELQREGNACTKNLCQIKANGGSTQTPISDSPPPQNITVLQIRKILMRNKNFVARIPEFGKLMGVKSYSMEQDCGSSKTLLNSILYTFEKCFAQRSLSESVIRILEDEMTLQDLADEIKILTSDSKMGVSGCHKPNLPTPTVSPSNKGTARVDIEAGTETFSPEEAVAPSADFPEACKRIEIQHGQTGVSYEGLFGPYLNQNVRWVEVADPYLIKAHQVVNVITLVDLVLSKCNNLEEIRILTKRYDANQLAVIQQKCKQVCLKVEDSLHDRWVSISESMTMMKIVLGRGLDMFKNQSGKMAADQKSRECLPCCVIAIKCLPTDPDNVSKVSDVVTADSIANQLASSSSSVASPNRCVDSKPGTTSNLKGRKNSRSKKKKIQKQKSCNPAAA